MGGKSGEWGIFRWRTRGTGIDLEPSMVMYGVVIGVRFFGMLHKDKPTQSSKPLMQRPYRASFKAASRNAKAGE